MRVEITDANNVRVSALDRNMLDSVTAILGGDWFTSNVDCVWVAWRPIARGEFVVGHHVKRGQGWYLTALA